MTSTPAKAITANGAGTQRAENSTGKEMGGRTLGTQEHAVGARQTILMVTHDKDPARHAACAATVADGEILDEMRNLDPEERRGLLSAPPSANAPSFEREPQA